MKYLVIYERAEDGTIWGRVPDLEGCYSFGNTLLEAKSNINEAIHLHLEVLQEDNMTILEPKYFDAEMVLV
ncbi:MAG: type II toxin-antitoxin system HicB family antitoxin [Cytophagales bacterium]|nr:MAG: type II toxin-antitoxin system HicB family antitoxin [Cytophagales bacterium]